jgi:hypothetical protein
MWLTLLRRRVSGGRMTFALVSLTSVILLNGCWELAGPLIGVGVVGGGVGVAAATRAPTKARPDPAPVHESSSDSAESVPQSSSLRQTNQGSPVIAALPTSSDAAVPSPAVAVGEAPRKARAHRRKPRAVVRSSKPKRLKGQSPLIASQLLTAPPDTLPATVIVH